MGESNQHITLVENITSFIYKNINNIVGSLIYTDLPYSLYKPRSVINGFIPDVYYNYNGLLIIGEAKTDNDVERVHSINQYISYFQEAQIYDYETILIFSVTWKMYGTIKNIIRLLKFNNNFKKIKVIVINNKGDVSYL